MATTNSTYTSPDWEYFKYPLSISPIPDSIRRGMIVLCAIALLSCITTLSLLGFLSYRFFAGRHEYGTPLHKNQYVLLIYSLMLADFQLDLGFLLDLVWLDRGQIVAPSAGCTAQGWLVNLGDLGSGFFVSAIAFHTFLTVVYGRKIGLKTVCWSIVSLWVLAAILTMIPIAMHPGDIFAAQGSWCSINARYNILRLYFHYIWDFIAEFAVLVIYTTTFLVVRRRMGGILPDLTRTPSTSLEHGRPHKSRSSRSRVISRATMYMFLYPLIYMLSTLPLAAGRISGMAGRHPSTTYLVVAGCLMACGGWMNCIVYSLTRRIFHTRNSNSNQDAPRVRSGSGKDSAGGTAIEMSGSQDPTLYRGLPSPVGSTNHVAAMGKSADRTSTDINAGVQMERTWEVRTEEVAPSAVVSEDHELGYHTYVSHLEEAEGSGNSGSIT